MIWDFAGEQIPDQLLADLDGLASHPTPALEALLSPAELAAVTRRAAAVVKLGRFPHPGSDRPYPWPMV